MRFVIVILAWAATGLVIALVMRRRGHDLAVWLALGIVFGPFAAPLASKQVRRALLVQPRELSAGEVGPGHLDLLVGIDGSEQARVAAGEVVDRLGTAIHRVTLAGVVDIDASASLVDPQDTDIWGEDERHVEQCRDHLEAARAQLEGVEPGSVMLAGDPTEALTRYAADEGYDFIVVGARGHGASKALLGSVAEHLARGSTVPVIIGRPAAAAPEHPGGGDQAGPAG